MDDVILGAVVYELEVEQGGSVPGFAGRLLHAGLFHLLQQISPELSAELHDGENVKPFAVSPIISHEPPFRMIYEKEPRMVKAGTRFFWRVSAWRTDVVEALLAIPAGAALRIGQLECHIVRVRADGHQASGLAQADDLLAAAFSQPFRREVAFHFRSPVAFRRDRYDYPLPEPRLVFASLADKWQQAHLPGMMDRGRIGELAEEIYPIDWQGRTKRVYFGQKYGLCGFVGDFTYSLRALDEESAGIVTLLAQFATFSGTGRMTGQGFGQTRVTGK